jgi:hypothetical protein
MNMNIVITLVAGIALFLYLMRRRVRLGRRAPKF